LTGCGAAHPGDAKAGSHISPLSPGWRGEERNFRKALRRSNNNLTNTKQCVHTKPIAVLKNTMQNEAYMKHIQGNMEKSSNSHK
jgi:hypothetical protein